MRVYVEAYGCSQNRGEASDLTRALGAAGHQVLPDPRGADVGVLVTCGVIGSTEDRMVRRWAALSARIPKLVVTGCLVPLRQGRFEGPGRQRTTFLRISDQARLPEILAQQPVSGHAPVDHVPRAPVSSAAEEVVIAQGCTSHCSYCFSRLARGPLTSRTKSDVVDRTEAAIGRGAVEVRLSSLDTTCWGMDHESNERLPDLLRAVTALPGRYRVRVGMASPQTLGPVSSRLFAAMANEHVFHFLHLPFQSGSDRVLEAMRRGYGAGTIRRLVAEARRALPDLMLATDVIVGFPGETDDEFAESLALVQELDPEVVNVTRFSPRPYTRAKHTAQLPPGVLKRRSRSLTELRLSLARRRMERWIGWTGVALTVERGRDSSTVARLPNYLPLVLSDAWPLGEEVEVRVHGARSTYLVGEPRASETPRLRVGA